MREAVRHAFIPTTEGFEASTDYFYSDRKGLVSIAKGFLADPLSLVLGLLDFVRGDGSLVPASPDEIRASWKAVKARVAQELAEVHTWEAAGKKRPKPVSPDSGGAHYQYVPGNKVRATKASIERATTNKMLAFEAVLKKSFPAFEDWPADAQLGLLLMSWAYGAAFAPKWPHFTAAARRQDWLTCAAECKPSAHELAANNNSFKQRCALIEKLFTKAATAKDSMVLS